MPLKNVSQTSFEFSVDLVTLIPKHSTLDDYFILFQKLFSPVKASIRKLHKEFWVCLEFISYIEQEDGDLGCLLSEDYLLCLTDLKNSRRDTEWGNSKKYRRKNSFEEKGWNLVLKVNMNFVGAKNRHLFKCLDLYIWT